MIYRFTPVIIRRLRRSLAFRPRCRGGIKWNEERWVFFCANCAPQARRPFIKVRSFLLGPINLIASEIYGVWHAEEKISRASVFMRSIVRYFLLVLLDTSAPLRLRNNFVPTPSGLASFPFFSPPTPLLYARSLLAAQYRRWKHIYDAVMANLTIV